jgi:hypothetical protein
MILRMACLAKILLASTVSLGAPALDKSLGFGLNFGGSSDSFSVSKTPEASQSFVGASLYFKPGRESKIEIGLEAFQITQSLSTATTQSWDFSGNDVLVGARLNMGKSNIFYLSAFFGVASRATFLSKGSPEETWTGNSAAARLGVRPRLSESFVADVSLFYIQSNYTRFSTTSLGGITKTLILPQLGLFFYF